MFGRGISRDVLAADARGYRSYINDASAALVDQRGYEGLADIVDTGKIDRQHMVPELIGMVQEFMAPGVSGVIDQDIHPAYSLNKRRCHMLNLLRIGHIAGDSQALSPLRSYLSDELLDFVS